MGTKIFEQTSQSPFFAITKHLMGLCDSFQRAWKKGCLRILGEIRFFLIYLFCTVDAQLVVLKLFYKAFGKHGSIPFALELHVQAAKKPILHVEELDTSVEFFGTHTSSATV